MRKKFLVFIAFCLVVATTVAGCTGRSNSAPQANAATLRLGMLPIIDNLPFWVAEQKGYFKAEGLNVQLVPFPSAVERDSAFTAGQIDAAVGDLLAVAELNNAGTPVKAVSLCMGVKPGESRFAVLSAPRSDIRRPAQLKNVPVAISPNSIIEYVTDRLLEDKGLSKNEIKKASIPKMPVRLEALLNGSVQAATLPDPLATLAQIKGAHIVADTLNDNVAQTVLMVRLESINHNLPQLQKLMRAYTRAVRDIQANPAAYNGLLAKEARVPAEVLNSSQHRLPVHFSAPQLPPAANVQDILQWMQERKLLTKPLTYNDMVDTRVLEQKPKA
ncbi:ABC transporter substrate-binding protein [Desulfotomaculum copahuensis]|uniref:Myristoyl transferase n=1 Tax=Desulfotomaculum copahuensis TaxID=1838280 RepID=A0A1B7LCA7_9FIRM|nr:MetQ/NlpA family ABC transporter substrate-binding protein [Desulfotomaculum copahuensis]OAT80299.1 myristoyl transferase [Desulfotomaculum copahuensis]